MEDIKTRLLGLGFFYEKIKVNSIVDLHIFRYKAYVDRDAIYSVDITNEWNTWDIQLSKQGMESGIEGIGQYVAFHGKIETLSDLEVLFRLCMVNYFVNQSENKLLKK